MNYNGVMRYALTFLFATILLSGTLTAVYTKPSKAAWTFMIYLDADNNLDPYGPLNLQQISEGISPKANINVVALMDRLNLTAYVYRITAHNIETVYSLGEVDMGSPETLTWFVKYAIKNYPAEHYLIDIWDHGGGYRGVCWDDSSGDHLSPHNIEKALADAEKKLKTKIDIVGFDACLMGMIEVCYELKDVTKIVIGSEMLVPGYGWPYKTLMQYLSTNPTVDPYVLSQKIVTEYVAYYANFQSTFFVQLSAINEASVPNMAESLNALADYLAENTNAYRGVIADARGASQQKIIMGTMGAYYYIDLYKFTKLIREKISGETLGSLASNLMHCIDAMVFAEDHTKLQGDLDSKQYGLTVNFPPNKQAYNANYEKYVQCFVQETTWLNLLMAFYSKP
jgi:hypothetical protein